MPKYLVTATAYRESTENPGAFSPRTFTFEVTLDTAWSAKNSAPVGDLAFHECHRAFGFWPKQTPQIDVVTVLVDRSIEGCGTEGPSVAEEALFRIIEMVDGAEQADVWDHLSIADFRSCIPQHIIDRYDQRTVQPSDDADLDELI